MKRSDQRGIAVIFEVVAVAVVLLVIGIVASKVYQARTGKSLINSVVPAKYTLNSKCDYNDPDLCKWLNNTDQFTNFKSTSTYTILGKAQTSTTTVDGDKYQSATSEDGKENSNFILIGDTTYTKDYTDNKWFKETTKPDAKQEDLKSTDDLKNSVNDAKPDKLAYKKVGKEACGKLNCFKYTLTEAGANTTVWFDDNEYKLRKMESGVAGQTFTVEYSYDNTSISAPSPTKDTAPAPAAASVPTQAQIDAALQQAQAAAAAAGVDDSSQ
jgi:hypothetical protein